MVTPAIPWQSHCIITGFTSLLMQGVSNKKKPKTVTSEHTVKVKESTLCNVFQIWTHLFSRPLVLPLPSPSMKVSLHGCPGFIFPGQFSCRPRCVLLRWSWCISCIIPDTFSKSSWFLWNCWCSREVKVPSNNQVYVTETSLIYLEKMSSISHPDHAVYNKLSGSWSTSSQQDFFYPDQWWDV